MKLIVGLGNPGKLYIDSRHNIGFQVVKALGKFHKVAFKKDNTVFSLSAKCKIGNEVVLLAMPFTYMNSSGLAIRALLKKYKVDLENLLVIHDDLDLEFGRLRIRPKGSSGGHQGVESIIDSLKSDRFCRLRIGIGRPRADINASEYVLSFFTKKEKGQSKEFIRKASLASEFWVREGITKTMNVFNQRDKI